MEDAVHDAAGKPATSPAHPERSLSSLGHPTRVAFQGALGAFSEEAAHTLVSEAEPVACATFGQVVESVVADTADLGVLPVENTLAGAVVEAYDAVELGDVSVVAEAAIPIRHFLLGLDGSSIDRLREVRSHPVALAQCRDFFLDHPDVRAHAVYDTAGAAREVAKLGDEGLAAVASRGAADRYGLRLLARDIQDRHDNQTRFYLIAPVGRGRVERRVEGSEWVDDGVEPRTEGSGRVAEGDEGVDRRHGRTTHVDEGSLQPGPAPALKTALVAELENRVGSLHALLGIFAARELSLTHVASRPAASPWTYRFIVEFEHDTRQQGAEALAEVTRIARRLRVLGSFPAWPGER